MRGKFWEIEHAGIPLQYEVHAMTWLLLKFMKLLPVNLFLAGLSHLEPLCRWRTNAHSLLSLASKFFKRRGVVEKRRLLTPEIFLVPIICTHALVVRRSNHRWKISDVIEVLKSVNLQYNTPWLSGLMGQKTRPPSVWCSKYYSFS
jgi:hypothetical protein